MLPTSSKTIYYNSGKDLSDFLRPVYQSIFLFGHPNSEQISAIKIILSAFKNVCVCFMWEQQKADSLQADINPMNFEEKMSS